MTQRVQSVERSIDILLVLADAPRTLTEVANRANLSKATTFRLLASLAYGQLVIREPGGSRYVLGPGFLRLLQGTRQGFGALGALARPALETLLERTGETIALHVRLGQERLCVEELQSPAPIRYAAAAGQTAPLYAGSAGKTLLAFLKPDELQATLDAMSLAPITDQTVTDRGALLAELEEIRKQGFATSGGERFPGAAAVSMPIRDTTEQAIASISVLGPADRFPPEREPELVRDLRRAVTDIEQRLRATGAPEHDPTTRKVTST